MFFALCMRSSLLHLFVRKANGFPFFTKKVYFRAGVIQKCAGITNYQVVGSRLEISQTKHVDAECHSDILQAQCMGSGCKVSQR